MGGYIMNITINLTDRQKKAIRYLGVTQNDLESLIIEDANARIESLTNKAKQTWLATQTMDDIDPTPI